MKSFGQNLKLLREQNNMNQQELAEKLGTSQPRISEWERDKVEPTLYNIIRLVNILHVTFEELTDDVDDI
ncbi:MAG: helix-turn-helix domain-containing protein [Christensenellales bacterium]|jgi:transcriptional regulator, cro/CI family